MAMCQDGSLADPTQLLWGSPLPRLSPTAVRAWASLGPKVALGLSSQRAEEPGFQNPGEGEWAICQLSHLLAGACMVIAGCHGREGLAVPPPASPGLR